MKEIKLNFEAIKLNEFFSIPLDRFQEIRDKIKDKLLTSVTPEKDRVRYNPTFAMQLCLEIAETEEERLLAFYLCGMIAENIKWEFEEFLQKEVKDFSIEKILSDLFNSNKND